MAGYLGQDDDVSSPGNRAYSHRKRDTKVEEEGEDFTTSLRVVW